MYVLVSKPGSQYKGPCIYRDSDDDQGRHAVTTLDDEPQRKYALAFV